MVFKKLGIGAMVIAAIVTLVLLANAFDVRAQVTSTKPTLQSAARDVTMTGRVVDLHCYMTGQMLSADAAKCTADCLRAGVGAGLETEDGLIVLGQGVHGPVKTLIPFAYQNVEVRGKLYERTGLQYLDIQSVERAGEAGEGD